jgi:hypothetical protein
MRRWDNIITAPLTQYERFFRMVRIINDLNDDYRGDLLVPDETGRIHINREADNGRASTGYSRSVITISNDPHQERNRILEEEHQWRNDIRLAELTMDTHFNRLSENERLIMIERYFRLKGKEKLPRINLSERQLRRIQRFAEFHLIVEWGLNIYDKDGFLRGVNLVDENDAFFLEGKVTTDRGQLGEPRKTYDGKTGAGRNAPSGGQTKLQKQKHYTNSEQTGI